MLTFRFSNYLCELGRDASVMIRTGFFTPGIHWEKAVPLGPPGTGQILSWREARLPVLPFVVPHILWTRFISNPRNSEPASQKKIMTRRDDIRFN